MGRVPFSFYNVIELKVVRYNSFHMNFHMKLPHEIAPAFFVLETGTESFYNKS